METSSGSVGLRAAERLRECRGVAAITIGGSFATGLADASSDVDLGLYYERRDPIDLPHLSRIVAGLDDRRSEGLITGFGEWGPWVNGGGWLRIQGQRVDVLYRDLQRVREAIEDCRAGVVTHYFQPGHPAGYSQQIYAGEIDVCRPLYDPADAIATLRGRTRPYPAPLRRALNEGLWEAVFSLDAAEASARRGDVLHVVGCLFRAVVCLLQALFGSNETYWINEKRALDVAERFAMRPADLKARVQRVLSSTGTEPHELAGRLSDLKLVVDEVRDLIRSDDRPQDNSSSS